MNRLTSSLLFRKWSASTAAILREELAQFQGGAQNHGGFCNQFTQNPGVFCDNFPFTRGNGCNFKEEPKIMEGSAAILREELTQFERGAGPFS